MGLISIAAVFILSIGFLIYNYPDMLRSIFPGWLASAPASEASGGSDEANSPPAEPIDQSHDNNDAVNGEQTPRAEAREFDSRVPSFSLTASGEEDEPEPEPPAVPSFPAPHSAQRASTVPSPFNAQSSSSAELMPPPPRPALAPRQSAAASLRVPTTGPLPNRGPPLNSQQRVGGGLSPNALVKTPSARGKVLLAPGHSPMDWAALTRKSNLGGVSGFQRITPSQLKTMTGRKGKPAWSVWQGKVYNITPYLPFHPGGEAELMKAAGRDGTKLFMDVHPWVNWENMLDSCLIGVMVPEDSGSAGGSSLEEMD